MKFRKVILYFIVITFFSISRTIAFDNSTKNDKLVSTEWLDKNLNHEKLVILHYGKKEDFEKEHIPNARLISIRELIVDKENGLRHELPDDKKIESVIKSWGIDNDSKIVICYGDEMALLMAARLYMALDYSGLGDQTSILNGGFTQWKNEDRVITSKVSEYQPGNFKMKANKNVIVDKKWILENLDNPNVAIVDARPEDQYSGSAEDHNSPRRGHIQGAVNVPFFKIQSDDKPFIIKDKSELQKLFEDNFVSKGVTVVTYCGSGIWAAPVYFVARCLGYNARFYDGSIQEWGNDDTLPVTPPVNVNSD
ncbi:MAG: hypothetical protein A2V66_00440 [Ignavibacteria bacterium RBG_13_36_8]|nr:MAG: hypothetical protein A2V66_00440 [Ignavibacteria bacterium RBG_13_36_8]